MSSEHIAPRVAIIGSGLAGLVAALAASEHGAEVVVFERLSSIGGASAQSAGWIWRYNDTALFRACAPHGDPDVQRRIVEQLDDDLEWLTSHGVRLVANSTGRAVTNGVRVEPSQLIATLARRLGEEHISCRAEVVSIAPTEGRAWQLSIQDRSLEGLSDPAPRTIECDAIIAAGGGYVGDIERLVSEGRISDDVREGWRVRPHDPSDGSSMAALLAIGALRPSVSGESLVRVAPDLDRCDADERLLIRMSELHTAEAQLERSDGELVVRASHDWSGAQQMWELARTSGRGWLVLDRAQLRQRVHSGIIEDIVRDAIRAGVRCEDRGRRGIALEIVSGLTHTRCGVRVDVDGRVLIQRRGWRGNAVRPLDGVYAAGCDAAEAGLGGTASGLAQALVQGRAAGRHAAARVV
jgi:hypothetical protein